MNHRLKLLLLRRRADNAAVAEKKKTVNKNQEESEMKSIKSKLDKLSIFYNPNTGLKKLREKLELAQSK